jgi:hypothetical protein
MDTKSGIDVRVKRNSNDCKQKCPKYTYDEILRRAIYSQTSPKPRERRQLGAMLQMEPPNW